MERKPLVRQLSPSLFWDVELEGMDEQVHGRFIICRVMDRGTLHDVQAVWNHYGAQAVQKALLESPALHRKTIFFFANQFNLRPEDFRAYRKSQELGIWDG